MMILLNIYRHWRNTTAKCNTTQRSEFRFLLNTWKEIKNKIKFKIIYKSATRIIRNDKQNGIILRNKVTKNI